MKKETELIRELNRFVWDIVSKCRRRPEQRVPPKFELSNRTRAWGDILRTTDVSTGEFRQVFTKIRVSRPVYKWELFPSQMSMLNHLIDTLCHEYAHMTHWEHDELHKDLTEYYKAKVSRKLHIRVDEDKPKKTAAKEVIRTKQTLASICDNPKQARRLFRKAGIKKPGTKWEWEVVPPEVNRIIMNLNH